MQELALKHVEKRIKEYERRQQKMQQVELKAANNRTSSVLAEWRQRLWSGSQGNLKKTTLGGPTPGNLYTTTGGKFSSFTKSSTQSSVQRKVQAIKSIKQATDSDSASSDFKIGEIDLAGKRSVRSLQGVRRDSEVIYVGTFSSSGEVIKRGKIADVFEVEGEGEGEGEGSSDSDSRSSRCTSGSMARSLSQPDFTCHIVDDDDDEDEDDEFGNDGEISEGEEILVHRRTRLFDRPMFGTLAFGQSVSAALSELQPDASSSSGTLQFSFHNSSILVCKLTHIPLSIFLKAAPVLHPRAFTNQRSTSLGPI